MKFQKYLKENTDFDALYDYIKKNCKPFLKEFGKKYLERKFIYRGMQIDTAGFVIKNVRKDRKPRVVDKESHKFLSEIGKKIFGWDIRKEGVFTGGLYTADNYGILNIFIPIGKYKYVYVKDVQSIYGYYDSLGYAFDASKLWNHDRKNAYWLDRPDERKEVDKEDEKDIDHWKKKIEDEYKNKYKTKGLSSIINTLDYESIFKCDNYIAIKNINENKYKLIEIIRSIK